MRFAIARHVTSALVGSALLTSLAACSSHSLIGEWNCDQTFLEEELFTLGGVSRWYVRPSGVSESRIEYLYTFPGHGSVAALLVVVADWEVIGNEIIEYTRDVTIEEFWTDLDGPRETIEAELLKIHPLDEDWRANFEFETPNVVLMTYPDGSGEDFRCRRRKP